MPTRTTFLERLIERLDRLDTGDVQNYLQKLIKEKGFLETVFNTIHEGIVVIDRNLHICYFNNAVRDFLGLPEESEGVKLGRYARDIDWHGLLLSENGAWRGYGFHELEVFYPRHRILAFYLVPHPVEEVGGHDQRATLIFQDVTDQRRYTEEAIENRRAEAITELAAGVAHEIGNPLNSLNIHLQLLSRHLSREDPPDSEKSRELLDIALHEVERLDSITNEFLRAVRPVKPNFAPVQVQKILAESLSFMRREIEDRGIRVEASLPDKLPVVQGDAGQLKQAFYNVIKNSIYALPEGGVVDIACVSSDQFLEINFTDYGKGIKQENMGRITEPYFTTREEGGGLGLMIVQRIVRAHYGELSIESEEGEWTSVTLRLPIHGRQARLLAAARREGEDSYDSVNR